jgi:hypothetical protein
MQVFGGGCGIWICAFGVTCVATIDFLNWLFFSFTCLLGIFLIEFKELVELAEARSL